MLRNSNHVRQFRSRILIRSGFAAPCLILPFTSSNCTELLQAYKEKVKESGDSSLESLMQPSSNQVSERGDFNNGYGHDQQCSTPENSSEVGNYQKVESASNAVVPSGSKKKKKRNAPQDGEAKHNGDASSNKRSHKKIKRTIAPDSELGYTNGCVVDAYKGFSAKYDEPVILVSYKEPLPSGLENRQDEIVPIRLIAKVDPQVRIF
ncbi:hypothetical protein TELCIR_11980 [Teladorsagia circumcincta]|uniref:Uncharacterized protein n=1 Tax=Teladorsagia circumcincta TaxID=45464 RepID=A0A2G9U9Z0_TELCI|nr:hypothetical protein TELCIR_11980 [Teladorsagia circumcincta]